MKRFATLLLAVTVVAAFALPAAAIEHEFGGYWNTRFYSQNNFSGEDDTGLGDRDLVQTRTRLYYTAILNENLKFINKFEFDTTWGDDVGGDIGADGQNFEIKNSYVVFNMDNLETRVGIQPFQLGRGFIIDEDAAGIIAIYTVQRGIYLGFSWLHAEEGYAGLGEDPDDIVVDAIGVFPATDFGFLDVPTFDNFNDLDIDSYTFKPTVYLSKEMVVAPYIQFQHARNAARAESFAGAINNYNAVNLGLDFDITNENFSFFFTGIYQFGEIEPSDAANAVTAQVQAAATALGVSYDTVAAALEYPFRDDDDIDLKGYILALGGAFNMEMGEIHSQFVYASGDENDRTDSDYQFRDGEFNGFLQNDDAASYYWAEIMGQGMFDNLAGGALNVSNNAPGDDITNVWFANLGVEVQPIEKMEVALDLWYAQLVEDVEVLQQDGTLKMEDELGFEVDLRVSFELVENLNLDLVAAYLFAGDATEREVAESVVYNPATNTVTTVATNVDEADPWEMGAMLSLAF